MKKIIIACSMIPAFAFAVTATQKEAILKSHIEELQKQGLPTPGSGVQLVPTSQLNMPEWQEKKLMMESREQERNGYVNRASMRANELINIQAHLHKVGIQSGVSMSDSDSELCATPEDIQFAYTYIGVPKSEMEEFYGIAPAGAYVKEPQSGWTGGVQFFKTAFSYCAYTEKNFVAGRGAVQVDQNMVQYDVNGKVTLIDVEGNTNTGFLYRVNWFDNSYNRDLECATKEYSEATRNATIELARRIDKA